MLFIQLSSNSSHFWVNLQKPISFCHFRPASVQNSQFCTEAGLKGQNEIGYS